MPGEDGVGLGNSGGLFQDLLAQLRAKLGEFSTLSKHTGWGDATLYDRKSTDGSVVASTQQTRVGADLSIRLADGRVLATTSAVEPATSPEEDHA